jgi:hypothetical protein
MVFSVDLEQQPRQCWGRKQQEEDTKEQEK